MELKLTLMGLASTLVTAFAMPKVVCWLISFGIFDHPNARSLHAVPVPRGAGFAIFIGFSAALLLGLQFTIFVWILLVGLTAIGGADDVWGLRSRSRLIYQFIVTISASVFIVIDLSNAGPIGVVLVAIFLVAAVNATNFMDGLNGMTGLHAIFWAIFYLFILIKDEQYEFLFLPVCLLGASLIFLYWNFPAARVFLGDSGSYLIGGMVGLIALIVYMQTDSIVAFVPSYIYAVDTGFTLLSRIIGGHSPFEAHRSHTYQRLVGAGISKERTVFITLAFTIVGSVGAEAMGSALSESVPPITLFIASLSAIYIALPTIVKGLDSNADS